MKDCDHTKGLGSDDLDTIPFGSWMRASLLKQPSKVDPEPKQSSES